MLFTPRERTGFNKLTPYDLSWQFLLFCMSIIGWRIAVHLLYGQIANGWAIALAVLYALLWLILALSASRSYSSIVGQRGLLMPNQFCLIYAGIILVHWLFYAAGIIWGIGCWFLTLVLVGVIRTNIDFHLVRWLGRTGEYIRPAGWVKRYYRLLTHNQPTLNWGGMDIPFNEATRNVLWMGAISAGKTMSMKLFMASFLRYIGAKPEPNKLEQSPLPKLPVKVAVVYDAKRDIVPWLKAANPHCEYHIVNHKDQRCSVWLMHKDCQTPDDCRTIGVVLSPPVIPGPSAFWAQASQSIIEGLCLFLMLHAPGSWDLRDVIIGAASMERLKTILGSDPRTERYLEALQGDRLSHSILTTVQVYLSMFAPIASAWHYKRQHAEEHGYPLKGFAFNDIHEMEGYIVLGRDADNQVATAAMNRLFITKFGRVILNRPDNPCGERLPQFLLCLDEAHTLGELAELEELSTNASSKGVCIALAMQSKSSFQRIYGHDSAEAIFGQFYYKVFMRLNDATTSRWASELIGRGDRFMRILVDGKWKQSDHIERRVPVVEPEDLRRFEPPAKGLPGVMNKLLGKGGSPLRGFYTGNFGFWNDIPPKYLSDNLIPADKNTKAIEPLDIPLLKTWDWSDIERLGLDKIIDKKDFAEQLDEERTMQQSAAVDLERIRKEIEKAMDNPSFKGEEN